MVNESQVDLVDLEPEDLRLKIEESREALSDKIAQLEEKVAETVESATASVAEVTANVAQTVQDATTSVSETVGSMTDAVQDTVNSVRQSVEGTVDSVKGAFELRGHVERHPWLMLAAAVSVGFFGEQYFRPSRSRMSRPAYIDGPTRSLPLATMSMQNGNNLHSDPAAFSSPPISGSGDTYRANNNNGFASEIGELQRLAIGAALNAAREIVVKASPQPLQEPLGGLFDHLTEKLGGTPLKGSMFQ